MDLKENEAFGCDYKKKVKCGHDDVTSFGNSKKKRFPIDHHLPFTQNVKRNIIIALNFISSCSHPRFLQLYWRLNDIKRRRRNEKSPLWIPFLFSLRRPFWPDFELKKIFVGPLPWRSLTKKRLSSPSFYIDLARNSFFTAEFHFPLPSASWYFFQTRKGEYKNTLSWVVATKSWGLLCCGVAEQERKYEGVRSRQGW